jgi:hypothetical protein
MLKLFTLWYNWKPNLKMNVDAVSRDTELVQTAASLARFIGEP